MLVELAQLVEVELILEVAGLVHPTAQFMFEHLLLGNQTDAVDTLVHADGVLPVVGTLGVLGVVHDADGLGGTHVANHHVLLDTANLSTCGVLSITLQNAVAGEVTTGGAGITHGHGEVAGLVALHGHGSPVLGVIGHVLLTILGRTVGHRVGIDAEDGEVTGLTGPHPVVGLATKLTHGFGNGKHQAHVLEVAVGGEVVLVALVERLDLNTQRGVLDADLLGHGILNAIDEVADLAEGQVHETLGVQLGGNVALLDHEAYEEVFVGQLLGIALGVETVEHIVVLHGRVLADAVEATVVVGEYQTVGTDNNA